MLLRSYSYMKNDIDLSLYYDIWQAGGKLVGYSHKCAGGDGDEVLQTALMHALSHYSRERGRLQPYLMKLVREIAKGDSRIIPVDFLEETVMKDMDDDVGAREANLLMVTGGFEDDVVDVLASEHSAEYGVVCLALEYMPRFMSLCESFLDSRPSGSYYPESFRRECLKLAAGTVGFNDRCVSLYLQNKAEMERYVELCDMRQELDWREANFPYIKARSSRSVFIVGVDGRDVDDAGIELCTVKGRIPDGAYVARVRYLELWEHMCGMVDSVGTNALKFELRGHHIVTTYAGSISVVDPEPCSMYDLFRAEILTNVLNDTGARLLNAGSENFYLLARDGMAVKDRDFFGYRMHMEVERW